MQPSKQCLSSRKGRRVNIRKVSFFYMRRELWLFETDNLSSYWNFSSLQSYKSNNSNNFRDPLHTQQTINWALVHTSRGQKPKSFHLPLEISYGYRRWACVRNFRYTISVSYGKIRNEIYLELEYHVSRHYHFYHEIQLLVLIDQDSPVTKTIFKCCTGWNGRQ